MPMPQISLTKLVIDDIVAKLKAQVVNELAVEYYPEKPANYRLNHANGALLVNYARSNYPKHDDTFAVIRPREQVFTVTIVARNLHDRYGLCRLWTGCWRCSQGIRLSTVPSLCTLSKIF